MRFLRSAGTMDSTGGRRGRSEVTGDTRGQELSYPVVDTDRRAEKRPPSRKWNLTALGDLDLDCSRKPAIGGLC